MARMVMSMSVQCGKAESARHLTGAWRVMVILATCALLCVFPGFTAYAWFNDVTDSYPASQDVPISGSTLTGADIPEGVYNTTATTSSYMCKLSNVTVTSVGGELWATFTMSGAYNALYLGTAEEAAASTNEDGTDVSAYYISDPLEGYVSRQFSLPIPALNEQITLATYSGGSKGIDGGMWYTRTVVFNSSKEIDDAIAGGGDGQEEGGDDTPSDVPDDSGDGGGYDPSDSGGDDSQGDESSADVVPDDSANDDSTDDGSTGGSEDEDTGSKDKSSSSAAPKNPSGTMPSSDTEGDQDDSGDAPDGNGENSGEEESSDAAASSESAAAKEEKASGGARMKEITFAGNQVVELGEGVDPELQQREKEQNEAQQTGMVAAGALGALNVALVGAYVVGLRRTKPQMFTKVAKKISRFRGKN